MNVWLERAATYRQLTLGLVIILAVILLGLLGPLFVDIRGAKVGAANADERPSLHYPLGTDTVGRELLPVIIVGTPLTLSIGLIAGAIGLGVGIIFGFVAGYYGGLWDSLFRGAADVFLTVPGLLILVVLASSGKGAVNVKTEALVVSALAWMWPTRTIRSQVLSMRERGYVQVAKFSGHEWHEDHSDRDVTQSAAVPRHEFRRRRSRSDPRLDRPRSAGAGTAESAHPGDDDLLGALLHDGDARADAGGGCRRS